MRRLLISISLALVAGLSVLLIGMPAMRAPLVLAANRFLSPHGTAGARGPTRQDGGGDQGRTLTILFANNPVPAPPFLVSALDGSTVSTAEWHGKVVLLTFWATWCPPCRDEIPMLIDLATRYAGRIEVIGVSMDDAPPEAVKQFTVMAGINYPIVMGSPEMVGEYGGVPALPTTFIMNTDGRIVQKHVGLYPEYVYETEVRSLLGLPVNAKVETFTDTGQIFLKNAANATELPGVDFTGLTAEQKAAVLKRLNSEICTCGCRLTIAQCRVNDSSCATSKALAAKIIQEVLAASHASSAAPSTHTESP
ncbi:MAG: TlpA disulfide reductase family protein [Candidatus Acidiferrales bacterium]